LEIQKQQKTLLLLAFLIGSLFLAIQVNFPSSNFAALGDVGTQVSGTLDSNTTWTAANSPYVIVDTIVVPENVILTITPGVTVTSQSSICTMFLLNGVVQAHGNSTDKIIFDGNSVCDFFKTNHPVAKGFLDLDYSVIRNGRSAFLLDNTAYLNLTNSDLSNLSQNSYLWYPAQDSFIEFNTFTNTSGIKVGTVDSASNSSGMVYVQYNLFINNQGYVINNFASYGTSKTYVNNNSFTYTSGVILEVERTSTTADMDASQNYWGTSDIAIIESMIYDKNDDAACSSFINYLPILDAPDPAAPVAPTPTPFPSLTPDPTDTPAPTPNPSTTPEPSSSPSPSSGPNATPTPSSSPDSSSTSESTNPTATQTPNQDAADTSLNPSATPTNLAFTPTQKPTASENPPVNGTSNNYFQIIILSALVVLAVGLIVYFAKHKL
jgi:hypothetical protein